MTGAQYIVDSLIRRGITDAFGIPGGVILRLIYEMDNRREIITPHLSYHEQSAGFAACGYAQSCGKLGVAYATRGPGFTNLLTPIADAYYDSLPVLFITAHASPCPPKNMRAMNDQEMDACDMVKNITKMTLRADDAETFADSFEDLCDTALDGRKGPVLLDVSTNILTREIPVTYTKKEKTTPNAKIDVRFITHAIQNAKRPVFLAGDGINQSNARELFQILVEKAQIPVISSRFSHDIQAVCNNLYYGYIGSHGIRSANFILSKSDLIVSIGNRMHFPLESESYKPILEHANIIRCDIDEGEFERKIPNTTNILIDLRKLISSLNTYDQYGNHSEWLSICDTLRGKLRDTDLNIATDRISNILKDIPKEYSICCDVGNNEFWVSRACVLHDIKNRAFYSKSFGAMGCGLGKAIGIYYGTKKPVYCFVGDQGFQMNIQELQTIVQNDLPITIVLLNNQASGMIRDREIHLYEGRCVHTTKDSGYTTPNFEKIVEGYGLESFRFMDVRIDEDLELYPQLPKGNPIQKMTYLLEEKLYDRLNEM